MISIAFRSAVATCLLMVLAGGLATGAAATGPAPAAPAQATATLPPGAKVSERIYHLPGLPNAGRVTPGIYRGAKPESEGYKTMRKMGIRTVIDLRTTESEQREVEAEGMKAIAIPIAMSRDGLREKVDRAVALMADPANQPVFVHCRHGQDRTGIVVAVYRMKVDGWSLADAEAEMQTFGFNDVWVNFKKFIKSYGTQLPKR